MNEDTLLEAYNQLMKDHIEAQNRLQDIGFEIEDAFTSNPKHSHAEYLNRIAKILGVIE
tara:strand:+ start:1101 stop:1277 length:177 start_codon:yes stop_codon:yes gene_type:complete